MLLLVGLGNPGTDYAQQRHNVGFMAVDAIARRHGFSNWRKKFQSELCDGLLGSEKVIALKPQTFMNLSGQAVAEAMRFYKLAADDVLVLHDELDLAAGKLRAKKGGGNAGHNGIRDITSHIGADFRRLRIGIGHPGEKGRVSGHVLSNFSRADADWLEPMLDAMADAAPLLVQKNGDNKFLTRVALLTQPDKDKKKADKPDGV